MVGENRIGSPGFVLKPRNRPQNEIFTFCRALCEYFFQPGSPNTPIYRNPRSAPAGCHRTGAAAQGQSHLILDEATISLDSVQATQIK